MEVILASKNGNDIAPILNPVLDMEIGGDNTFELSIDANEYADKYASGNIIYVPGSEYGGIIGGIGSETATGKIILSGMTFRGRLDKKIIVPPAGEAYRIVSGELNSILKGLVEPLFPGLFYVSDSDTGISIDKFQFDRYTTLLKGIKKMLKTVGYRLQLVWIQKEKGDPGYLEVSAVPEVDYSEKIELSQDSRVDFVFERKTDGITHLICLGKGELTERTVIHLYLQEDGTIGREQYYFGTENIEDVYENTNAESEELEVKGIEEFEKRMNKDVFDMDLTTINQNLQIGDIVGGRDYITGMSMKSPIVRKVLTIKGDVVNIENRLE